jgi:hypothetical protein
MADEAVPRLDGWEKYRIKQRIGSLLPVAEGTVVPTLPEIDEPKARAERRQERARVATTRMLLDIYRDQIQAGDVDERLRRFFSEQAERRIWCKPDPVEGLRQFLELPKRGTRPTRGAPNTTAARNFFLAADIQELIDQGKSVNAACGEVSDRLDGTAGALDSDYLRNLYFRETRYPVDKRAVRALIETRTRAEAERTQPNDCDDDPWICDRPGE